jgi:hypothetical protein
MFPAEDGEAIRELHVYDNLEDAEKVIEVLESVNYNFTCYALLMRPVWEDTPPKPVQLDMVGWDANGSPSF